MLLPIHNHTKNLAELLSDSTMIAASKAFFSIFKEMSIAILSEYDTPIHLGRRYLIRTVYMVRIALLALRKIAARATKLSKGNTFIKTIKEKKK